MVECMSTEARGQDVPALVGHCERYLQEVLGVAVAPRAWQGGGQLPFFLREHYRFFELDLLGAPQLLMVDPGSEQTPDVIEKHVAQLRKAWDGEVVYVRQAVTAYNRKRLIERTVAFLVPATQMYLPTLGVDLREHFRRLRSRPKVFSPATQVLLIHLLLHREETDVNAGVTPGRIKDPLGYSAITMTRAFDELEAAAIGAFVVRGRERLLALHGESRDIWQRAQDFLRTPVTKRLWCRVQGGGEPGPGAGLSALAHYTAIAEPSHRIVAVGRPDWKALVENGRVLEIPYGDPDAAEIEVWRYAPQACAGGAVVDPLSLWLALKDDPDERIEAAREELLEGLGW
jgi:hypothetical protein